MHFATLYGLLMIMSIYWIFLNIFCQHKGERYFWLKMAYTCCNWMSNKSKIFISLESICAVTSSVDESWDVIFDYSTADWDLATIIFEFSVLNNIRKLRSPTFTKKCLLMYDFPKFRLVYIAACMSAYFQSVTGC
jgi:hypothetical protein